MPSVLDLLVALNPWWNNKPFEAGIRRENYFARIQKYLKTGEIVVLTGVRRSGKTTLLFQIIDDLIRWVDTLRQLRRTGGDSPR